ncbi:MAG TPA: SDR family oxidoreductase [Candidatus Sulfotelmatobacter sp.]|nr:SDR family oxidoreductase [Candidatus Sulfotelmatobacter sp.]
MAKYLITGIAGFIGSNLAHALVARGEEVRGIDDLSHGRMENLDGIHDRVDFRNADITDDAAILSACSGTDYVLHQAARGSVPRSLADPVGSNHANITGTVKVLQAGREAGVKRVVLASSSSVYGNTPTLPKHEGMPCAPISPYAVSKYAGELYAQSFACLLNVETVSLRYFNVFGPRQHPTSEYAAVIPRFIRSMLAGEQPVIFGDGKQSRDFTFIDNVVSANLLACQAPAERVSGKVFNVATASSVSLNEMYSLLQELTGHKAAASHAPPRGGDVRDSLADNSRAAEAMGYRPTVDFKEGLRRTVEWYRQEFRSNRRSA